MKSFQEMKFPTFPFRENQVIQRLDVKRVRQLTEILIGMFLSKCPRSRLTDELNGFLILAQAMQAACIQTTDIDADTSVVVRLAEKFASLSHIEQSLDSLIVASFRRVGKIYSYKEFNSELVDALELLLIYVSKILYRIDNPATDSIIEIEESIMNVQCTLCIRILWDKFSDNLKREDTKSLKSPTEQ